ncbi:hypothetical protein BJX65DRAFT_313898 [Aspergillus insuetus]
MTSRRTIKRSREASKKTQSTSKNPAETSENSLDTGKKPQKTSMKQKQELLSSTTPAAERWKALKTHYRLPGSQHRGIFIPPSAPEGKFYIELGTVVEVGLNARGGI